MVFILILLLTLSHLLHSNQASVLHDRENLHLYHHVNVISGHIHLTVEDLQLASPVPYSLQRSYTSSGAFEKDEEDSDLKLKEFYGGWLIQGGGGNFCLRSISWYTKSPSIKTTVFF